MYWRYPETMTSKADMQRASNGFCDDVLAIRWN